MAETPYVADLSDMELSQLLCEAQEHSELLDISVVFAQNLTKSLWQPWRMQGSFKAGQFWWSYVTVCIWNKNLKKKKNCGMKEKTDRANCL